jgi:hypothetical protein
MHRIAWDLRYPPSTPASLKPPVSDPFSEPPSGPMVAPGRYTATLSKVVDGKWTALSESQSFDARGLYEIPEADRKRLLAFERKVARLQRGVTGAIETIDETKTRINHIKQALLDAPGADARLGTEVREIESRLRDIELVVKGDAALAARSEPVSPSVADRVDAIVGAQWTATSPPTGTSEKAYAWAAEAFRTPLENLRRLVSTDLKKVEDQMETAGAPWTPGRLPSWQPE